MAKVIVLLVVVGVTIYAVIDCVQRPAEDVRGLPKPMWVLVIVALAPLGGLAWLFAGRPQSSVPGAGRRVVAPDDDPDFLRSLGTRPHRETRPRPRRREPKPRHERPDDAAEHRTGDTPDGEEPRP